MEKFAWKNQNECFSLMLKDLATSGNFADVTLVLDDKSQIKSHKVILAAVSNFFKEILAETEDQEILTIHLSNIQYHELEGLLELIYYGELSTNQNEIIQNLCKQYQILFSKSAINNNSDGEYFEREEIKIETKSEGNI